MFKKKNLQKALFLFSMLRIKPFGVRPSPLYVNLVVNRRCNLKCAYCFGDYSSRSEKEYTLEELRQIINELYALGTRYVLIQGGESFLRKDLNEIIDYIDAKGILVSVVTNGTLVNRIKELTSLKKLDNICFSLDGLKDGNDAQRGEGVFDKVMQSIQMVRRYYPGLKIRINAVITKYTVDTFKEYLQFCWHNNIEVQAGLMFKDSPLAASPDKLESINQYLYRAKKKGLGIVASSSALKYVRDWPFNKTWVSKQEALSKLGKKAIQCQYGNYEIIIDSDGSVYPCNAMQGIFQPKNLREVGLKEAIDHLKTKPCYTCNIASMLATSEVINWNLGAIMERVWSELKR